MRKFFLSALLASLTLGFAGCGDEAAAPVGEEGPKAPGVPTEGPEAPKAAKSKRS
ncbi:hypothetical protein [Paludisphaera soli]|uniref:hypothetical protein n=1 Tax=Paludisphaera soli TaxID=2712865 RepID=UPI0013ED648C|nr:hypothetical protein [Paludisphaera soli]